MLDMLNIVGKLFRTHGDEQADLIKAMNSLIDHLRFRQVDCYCIVDSIMVQAEFAFTSLTDMDISELYDVKKIATTTTLSDPEVSVVKEAGCKPDLARHSPRLNLLYK
jgi:hypothetical protein